FMLELALDRKVLGLTEDIEAFLYEFGAWPKWASMDGLGTPLEGWWADYAAEVKQEPAEGPLITRVEALAISRATLERAEAERLLAAGVNTGGETMGPEILERADFGEWWEAGGWRNFAVFLLATGRVDAPNAEKRDIYVDGLESGAKDAAAFLRSLPLG
ncbi:MAG: hypothetical protein Q8R28_20680, partial [Dehalococcoidia bacterium]|nr:hypothetical protein [Dehalococcoidia bacterium]